MEENKEKRSVEEMLDNMEVYLQDIENVIKKKVKSREPRQYEGKMNSHIHIMINTQEKQKLIDKAKQEGVDFSEWCRRKLKEDSQLDRIENKIDKLSRW